jgi:hypothetical protein
MKRLMTHDEVETLASAIRSISHGGQYGPEGLEMLSMAIAGSDNMDSLAMVVREGMESIAEAISGGLAALANAISEVSDGS